MSEATKALIGFGAFAGLLALLNAQSKPSTSWFVGPPVHEPPRIIFPPAALPRLPAPPKSCGCGH